MEFVFSKSVVMAMMVVMVVMVIVLLMGIVILIYSGIGFFPEHFKRNRDLVQRN